MLKLDEIALSLLQQTTDFVKECLKSLIDYPGVHQNDIPKIEQELILFSWFAIDYLISQTQNKEKAIIIRNSLSNDIRDFADDKESVETINERFLGYAKIANEIKDEQARLFQFGHKFAEYCDLQHPILLIFPTEIFKAVLGTLSLLKSNGDI